VSNLNDEIINIDLNKLENHILIECATSTDLGLYAVIWSLGGLTNNLLWCRYYFAELIIKNLIEKEFVYLYKLIFNENYTQETIEKYESKEEMIKILSNPTTWYNDYSHIRVCIEITDKGYKENPKLFN
jgi:hypothetical protein